MPFPSIPTTPETLALTPGVAAGLGAALLLAGRKLFWLFVGVVGFLTATRLASEVFGSEHHDQVLVASLVAGLLGAVLAIVVQKIAVALAGAVTGAYLLDQFFRNALASYPDFGWVFLIAAALVGAVLMAFVFHWALIFLTSLAGAHLIAQMLPLSQQWLMAIYVLLFAVGVTVQSRRKRAAG